MPGLSYHLHIILHHLFHHSRIFHRCQCQTRTPTPPATPNSVLVTRFINKHITPFLNKVTEETSINSIQHLRTSLITVNKEYIAREQAEIDNLHHIIHEAQDILEIEAGEIDEDGTTAVGIEGTPRADTPLSDAPTYATDNHGFPVPFPETEIDLEFQVDPPFGTPFIQSLIDSYIKALYIRPQYARDLYGLYGESTIPGTNYGVGDLVALAADQRHHIPLLEHPDPVETDTPFPHCLHVGEHRPPSEQSYYPPTQVETLTEVELFDINADIWHTPLSEEDAMDLIALKAAESEEF